MNQRFLIPSPLTPHPINTTNLTANKTTIQQSNKTKPETKPLKIIQININGVRNKIEELKLFIKEESADIITIQESKLTKSIKTPNIQQYTAIRKDRQDNKGGGLIIYLNNSLKFTEVQIPNDLKFSQTEIQLQPSLKLPFPFQPSSPSYQ